MVIVTTLFGNNLFDKGRFVFSFEKKDYKATSLTSVAKEPIKYTIEKVLNEVSYFHEFTEFVKNDILNNALLLKTIKYIFRLHKITLFF